MYFRECVSSQPSYGPQSPRRALHEEPQTHGYNPKGTTQHVKMADHNGRPAGEATAGASGITNIMVQSS